MADMKALLDSLISLGKTVLPLIVPGAGPMIEIGERVIEAIDHAKATAGADTPAELDQIRGDLDARVNAHVDQTIANLRD